MKNKKKTNIVLYSIIMFIVFFLITELGIWGYGSGILLNAISNYPQGFLVISEAVLACIVLIVMLLFKNSYVFTQKREKITKGLFYGLFFILGSLIFIIIGGVAGGFKGGPAILNLVVGCFLIGVAEEFLCRGWLLNEFLERFGNTKKGVWYSIIISAIMFGLIHIVNIYSMGQAVSTTISQILNAASIGIMLGIIYYKTKNIWSVIVLHGLWDFSLFLSDIAPVTLKIEIIPIFSIIGIIFSLLICIIVLINIIPYIKDINAEPKRKSIVTYAIISIIFYILLLLISNNFIFKIGKEYKYDNLSLENYAVTRDNYEEYYINYNNSSLKLSKNENNNLLLTNLNTNDYIIIECEKLYDYIITEFDNYYILGYVDYTDSANSFLNYIYIQKNELSNDKFYLNSLKNNTKKYLLPTNSELLVINDYYDNKSYLGAYHVDYGYFVLTDDKLSVLNRD